MNPLWSQFLSSHGFSSNGEACDVVQSEIGRAAAGEALVAPLADQGVLWVSGPEAADFLHNLLTNDVKNLSADEFRLAGLCTAKGRMLADLLIWRGTDGFWLSLSADVSESIRKKLSLYLLRSKAKVEDGASRRMQLGIAGRDMEGTLRAAGLPVPAASKSAPFPGGEVLRLRLDRAQVAVAPEKLEAVWNALLAARSTPVGIEAWRWLDVAQGVPRIVAATQEAFVPQMVEFDEMGGVSFNKGCYPGQEIVARAHFLGKVKRHLYRCHGAARPSPGTAIFSTAAGNQSCGEIVAAGPSPQEGFDCLAVLQEASAQAGDLHVGALDGPTLIVAGLARPDSSA